MPKFLGRPVQKLRSIRQQCIDVLLNELGDNWRQSVLDRASSRPAHFLIVPNGQALRALPIFCLQTDFYRATPLCERGIGSRNSVCLSVTRVLCD